MLSHNQHKLTDEHALKALYRLHTQRMQRKIYLSSLFSYSVRQYGLLGEIDVTAKIKQVQELIRTLDINKPIDAAEGKITPLELATTLSIDEVVELLLGGRARENNELITHAVAARDAIQKLAALITEVRAADYSDAQDKAEHILSIVKREYASLVKSIDFLLQDKAPDDNEKNLDGAILTLIAAQEGCQRTVKLLLDNGATVDQSMQDGFTPLVVAADNGHIEIVKLLLKIGAIVDLPANNGATPFIKAVQNGHAEAARLLLDNGANVDLQRQDGTTPLFIADQH